MQLLDKEKDQDEQAEKELIEALEKQKNLGASMTSKRKRKNSAEVAADIKAQY